MATALGYSPQFAAFDLIVLAAGHHVLQHFLCFDGTLPSRQLLLE